MWMVPSLVDDRVIYKKAVCASHEELANKQHFSMAAASVPDSLSDGCDPRVVG